MRRAGRGMFLRQISYSELSAKYLLTCSNQILRVISTDAKAYKDVGLGGGI